MRRILILFSLCGFAVGTVAGLVVHFVMAPDGPREAVASTGGGVPTFYLSGVAGLSDTIGDTIQSAVRHRLTEGGAALVRHPSDCTIDVGGTFTHEMQGENALVTLIWRVRTPQGAEIARLQMNNTVPAAKLNGDWSDDAPQIAHTVDEALFRIATEKPIPLC